MNVQKRAYETDVLVLGSSAAGCGAAIAARKAGAEVLLVDKGKLESSGCLGGGNDHFMAVLDEAEHDSLEDMYGYYATPASGMSRGVVKNYYRAMKPCLKVLEDSGIELMRNPDGTYMRSVGFGQPGPWWIHINHGFNVKPRLAKYVRGTGAKVVNHVLVINLLKDGDRIAGCIGFDVLKGDLIVVRCKTAVMGFGLTAQRVSNNSTHKPFNQWFSPYVTGSQVILPLEAGAGVLNVDITDMATMLPKGWGAPGMNGINNMGGHELNALGERFMGKYDPMWENGKRRNQIMGTEQEQLEGYGPPFYMDMRHFSPEDAYHLQYVLMPADKETYLDYCAARGIDFRTTPLEVEIGEMALSGMLLADERMETTVKGLFAGCNFTSFSGAMCGGYVAMNHAADDAAKYDMASLDEGEIRAWKEKDEAPLHNGAPSALTWTDFENPIRQVMDYYAGFRRNMPGMKLALEKLDLIASRREKVKAKNLHELMRLHEAFDLLELCRMHLDACLQRKESGRGMYKLADYPDLDPALDKGLVVRLENGSPAYSWLEKQAR